MSQARDPVCGAMIDTATASGGRIVHQSEELYFCSDTCRRSFEAEPGRFAAPKFGSAGSGGLEYEPLPERNDAPPGQRRK